MTVKRTVLERFVEKYVINQQTGCWEWTGSVSDRGYARLSIDQRPGYAHRWSYEYFVGPIPDGLVIDHLCRVPNCVFPGHLEPVTSAENTRRGLAGAWQREKTHCPKGHRYDEANTRWYRGMRYCKACEGLRSKRGSDRHAQEPGSTQYAH